mmetsp:Transcript_3548/g.2976  ORF Transcript_3548/g.2976 Transcript_3548/m.2976 type:complete len:93 (-) Transcript_3548:855-1133(-)
MKTPHSSQFFGGGVIRPLEESFECRNGEATVVGVMVPVVTLSLHFPIESKFRRPNSSRCPLHFFAVFLLLLFSFLKVARSWCPVFGQLFLPH